MNDSNPHIAKLRALKPRFREMNIKRLRVFGSQARGDARPDSDIDLLVDFIEPPGWGYAGLKRDLEETLGIEVDLVTEKSLKHPYIRRNVLEEARDV